MLEFELWPKEFGVPTLNHYNVASTLKKKAVKNILKTYKILMQIALHPAKISTVR